MGIARVVATALLVAAGCYSPSALDCSYTCNAGACPTGLHCLNNFCREDPHAQNTCMPGDGGGSGDGAGGAYASTILADGPIAYWRLGDMAGSMSARNEIGSNIALVRGTVGFGETGAIAGDPSSAARFDTNGAACLMVPTTSNIDFGPLSMFTLEAWIKLNTQLGADTRYIFAKQTASPMRGYDLRITSNGVAEFHLCYGAGCDSIAAPGPITGLEWVHVVATHDGAPSAHASLYVNANLVDTRTLTTSLGQSTDNLYLGCWFDQYQTDGWLDEIAIYNRALDVLDITRHYRVATGM